MNLANDWQAALVVIAVIIAIVCVVIVVKDNRWS